MRSFLSSKIGTALTLVALSFSGGSLAQNLVLNPSFESVNVGSLQCSWYTTVAQFNNAINNWTCPTGGSTDIFNTALATSCYCSPFSTNAASPGQQAPRTGNGYCNITVYGNGGCSPYREYIQGQLSSAMVVGQTYEVEMWVSLADKMSVGVNNLGIKFSANPYSSASMCVYNTTPDLNYTGPIILDKNNWVQILFCYTPTVAGLDNFIIGNFYSDAATSTAPAPGNTSQTTIRYFVEDVRIEAVTGGTPNAGTNGTISMCPGGAAVNLFASLGGTPNTNGTWSGPSALSGGYLGTFNPAVNTPGTYTYTVNGGTSICAGGGGTASSTVQVSIGAPANTTITPAGPFCTGNAPVTLSAVDPGGTWSGTGITNASTGTFSPAIAGPGTHTITYTISGPCGSSQSTNIVVNPNANPTITPVGPYCVGNAAVNLTATDPGGTWSGNGITNAANGAFNPATAGPGTHTITYTIGGVCGAVGTTNVVVNPNANATITPAGPFCESAAAVSLSAANTGGTWSGTGITDAVNGIFNPSVAGVGNHVITYTISGPCGDVQTTNISVTSGLNATITPAGPFCMNAAPQTLSAVDPGGTWSGTGITDAVNGVFSPSAAGAGSFVITYFIPGACGDTQTETIVVNPMANATIDPAGPFCAQDPVQVLTAANTGGTWSGTGITNAANGSFDPAVAGAGTYTITYSIAGACGDTQTSTIQVVNNADATINPAGPFCANDASTQLTALNGGGTWSGTGIVDPVNGFFDPQTAGTGSFTITYSIPGTCGDTRTVQIDVLPNADASIAPAGPFCASDAGQALVATNSGGVWSGNGITDPVNGIFDPQVAGVGTHTITYSIGGQCGDVQTSDIVVNQMDDATITPSGPYCLGTAPVTLVAATATGTWSGPGITDPVNGVFDPGAAGPGMHAITFVSNLLCPSTGNTLVEVLGPLSVQAFQDEVICEGDTVTLTAQGGGGDGNIVFTWADGNGNPLGSSTSLTVSPTQTSDYIVGIQDGCGTPMAFDQVTVTVNPIPQISFQPLNVTGCVPMTVTFENTSSPLGDQCSWSFGDGAGSTSCGTVTHTYTDAGCFDVSLSVSANGCSNALTFPNLVCLVDYPEADFEFLPEIADEFNPEYQFANTSVNASSYLWDFGDGSTSIAESPLHTYPSEITDYEVCLYATNDFGCTDTTCKPIAVVEGLVFYVPNSFTPDGDQFNQSFKPVFTSGFDPYNFEFYIMNRWGEVIWESHDASVGWDGTYNGKLVENGTYVWKAYFKRSQNDEKFVETGHVNVLR